MPKTQPRRSEPRFELEWTSEAWTEARALSPRARRPLMRAAAALAQEAEVETAERTPALARQAVLPRASWQLRIRGGHRLLYCIAGPVRADNRRIVWILGVLISGRRGDGRSDPPGAAVASAIISPAEARELRRRAEILRRIGGGIPQEVVRRAWILEAERARGGAAHR